WPGPPADHDVVVPVLVTVRADGSVSRVEMVESRGADYDRAATAAATEWRFNAATRDGAPVAARIRAEARFVAPPVASAPPPPVPAPPRASPAPPSRKPAAPPAPAPVATRPEAASPTAAAPVEVVVEGTLRPPSRGASDYTTPVAELKRVPRKNASD